LPVSSDANVINFVAYRKPYIPPSRATPVIVRTTEYIGEEHPIENKRVIVVPVDDLPLRDDDAIHKLKLLAGQRWSIRPPRDAGVSPAQGWGNGFIKIACDRFPKPAMNLKWACDTLDKLLEEANVMIIFCLTCYLRSKCYHS
jgi:small subunit ribosomal protein S35